MNAKKCLLAQQEEMSSCWTRRLFLLVNKKTCLLVQEDMSSCWTRRLVLVLNKKTCLLVEQEDMSSSSTRRRVFLLNKKTCLLVQQEDMYSCSTRRHFFLLNKKSFPIRRTFRISRLARSPEFQITPSSRTTWWSCLAISGLAFVSRLPDNMFPTTSRLLTSGQPYTPGRTPMIRFTCST